LTWSEPKCLLRDPIDPKTGRNMGSWATVAISKSGRLYVIYAKHIGRNPSHEQGILHVMCSDDSGETWSNEVPLAGIPRSRFDPDDPNEAPNGMPWQRAKRLFNGTVLLPITRSRLCSGLPPQPHPGIWAEHPCACEVIRFDNIDEDPDPADLKVTFLAFDEKAVSAPLPGHPECRSGEEPSLVELPDGHLFMVMRTAEGHVWYSVSQDNGETWREAEMLRFYDHGPGVMHPLSPCPLFQVSGNEFLLLVHGHDGYFGTDRPQCGGNWRTPVQLLRGEFRPGAHQPVWFSQPVEIMNNKNGVKMERADMPMYADLTIEDGEPVLWYPDRKFFLLGKRLPRTMLDKMTVPEQ